MAKKDKVGLIPATEAVARPQSGIVEAQSPPPDQAAPVEQDGVKAPDQAAAASPSQMENAMVQQILERQAVFGF